MYLHATKGSRAICTGYAQNKQCKQLRTAWPFTNTNCALCAHPCHARPRTSFDICVKPTMSARKGPGNGNFKSDKGEPHT